MQLKEKAVYFYNKNAQLQFLYEITFYAKVQKGSVAAVTAHSEVHNLLCKTTKYNLVSASEK